MSEVKKPDVQIRGRRNIQKEKTESERLWGKFTRKVKGPRRPVEGARTEEARGRLAGNEVGKGA